MVEKYDRFLQKVFTVLKIFLIALILMMIIILCVHVFRRYVMGNSLTWSEELLKIMLVWFALMSVPILAARREHVAIVIFKKNMPEKVARICTILAQALVVVICVIFTIIGIIYCIKSGGRLTPALRMPYGYAYAVIPTAFILVALFEFRNFLADLVRYDAPCIEKPEEDLTGGATLESLEQSMKGHKN